MKIQQNKKPIKKRTHYKMNCNKNEDHIQLKKEINSNDQG